MPDCVHRGALSRLVDCPSCGGNVQIKVFSCAQHGECTISRAIDGVHVCDAATAARAMGVPRFHKKTFAGTLEARLAGDQDWISVRLDDGSLVDAANERGLSAASGIRCVVAREEGRWILAMV